MARSRPPALRYWLLLGLALHVAVGLLLPHSASAPASTARNARVSEIDLEDVVDIVASPAPPASGDDGGGSAPSTHSEPRAPRAPADDVSHPSAARSVSPARIASDGHGESESSTALGRPEPAPSPALGSEPDAAAAAEPSARHLTLDALGVGAHNPFLGTEQAKADAPASAAGAGRHSVAAATSRLQSSLDTALAKRDQRIGLGPEGPVVAQLEQLVMQSSTAPNGDATLFVRTDAEGKLVYAEVQAQSGDAAEWERIARELQRLLGERRTRVPAGSKGISYKVHVSSREQLPSGAAPGLEINVLGITLKKGRGENSTKISILEPTLTTRSVPVPNDPAEREVNAVVASLSLFGLRGDPVDIGAPARRVVRAHVSDLTVH